MLSTPKGRASLFSFSRFFVDGSSITSNRISLPFVGADGSHLHAPRKTDTPKPLLLFYVVLPMEAYNQPAHIRGGGADNDNC